MKNKCFNIVLATQTKGGIGKNGDLPWRLPKDMNFFKNITTKT